MKIYDHPLNPSVTIVEIEINDEKEAFLNDVITGFELFGNTYPSASLGPDDENNKKVIYLDGRNRSVFGKEDFDILCALTVELVNIQNKTIKEITVDDCISLAVAAGNQKLIDSLMTKTPEYFNAFNTVRKSA